MVNKKPPSAHSRMSRVEVSPLAHVLSAAFAIFLQTIEGCKVYRLPQQWQLDPEPEASDLCTCSAPVVVLLNKGAKVRKAWSSFAFLATLWE